MKRMRRRYLSLLMCSISLLLVSCGKEEPKETQICESQWYGNVCLMEDGVLYKNPDTDRMEYFDYHTKDYGPLCAKPNCSHNSKECESVFLGQKAYFIGRLEDRWYYHTADEELGGSFRFCDLDGGNDKKIGEFPYIHDGSFGSRVLFYGNSCIFAAGKDYFEEETGEWTGTSSAIYWYRLDTGEADILCPEKTYMRPAYAVYGEYGSCLIYTEYNGETYALKQKNLETGEEKLLFEDKSIGLVWLDGNLLACVSFKDTNSKIHEINLDTGEQSEFPVKENIGDLFWTDEIKVYIAYENRADGKTGCQTFQYKDGDFRLLREGEIDDCFVPYILKDNILIGRLGGNNYGLAYIDKADFLAGKENWTLLKPES